MSDTWHIGVLGVGNVLMGDDGIGPFVIEALQSSYEFPPNVVLQDIGTPGLGIISFLIDYDVIILVDAVNARAVPGSIHLYRKHELGSIPSPHHASAHDPALVEALLFAKLSGKCPQEVLLVGVVPEALDLGRSLSSAVRSAVEPVISAVLAELHRLGISPLPRAGAALRSISWKEKVISNSPPMEAQDVPGYTR